MIGRLIGEQDDRPESDHVAVLSEEAWERNFGKDHGVVGAQRQPEWNGLHRNWRAAIARCLSFQG